MASANLAKELRLYIRRYLEIKGDERDSLSKHRLAENVRQIIDDVEGKPDNEWLDAIVLIGDIADSNQIDDSYESSDFTLFLYMIIHRIRNDIEEELARPRANGEPELLSTQKEVLTQRIKDERKLLNQRINVYIQEKKSSMDDITENAVYTQIRHLAYFDPETIAELDLDEIKSVFPDKVTPKKINELMAAVSTTVSHGLQYITPERLSTATASMINNTVSNTVSSLLSSFAQKVSSATSHIITNTMFSAGSVPGFAYPDEKSTDIKDFDFNPYLPTILQKNFVPYMHHKFWTEKNSALAVDKTTKSSEIKQSNENKIRTQLALASNHSGAEHKEQITEFVSKEAINKSHYLLDLYMHNREKITDQEIRTLIDIQANNQHQTIASWFELIIKIGIAADKAQKEANSCSLYSETLHAIRNIFVNEIYKNAATAFKAQLEIEKHKLIMLKAEAKQAKIDKKPRNEICNIEKNIYEVILRLAYLQFTDPLLELRPAQFEKFYNGITGVYKFEFPTSATAYGCDTCKVLPIVLSPLFPTMFEVKHAIMKKKFDEIKKTEHDAIQYLKRFVDMINKVMGSSLYERLIPQNFSESKYENKLTKEELKSFEDEIISIRKQFACAQGFINIVTTEQRDKLLSKLNEQQANIKLCETMASNYSKFLLSAGNQSSSTAITCNLLSISPTVLSPTQGATQTQTPLEEKAPVQGEADQNLIQNNQAPTQPEEKTEVLSETQTLSENNQTSTTIQAQIPAQAEDNQTPIQPKEQTSAQEIDQTPTVAPTIKPARNRRRK